MILIVGLGNPGKEYEETRHNTGFMAVDYLAKKSQVSFTKDDKFHALIARSDTKDIILVKPLTFMNLSGQAVARLGQFYKVKPSNIWVIYDDIDLPVGSARVRTKGNGKTSHRGVKSIILALESSDFSRFRIGIAHAKQNISAAERPHTPVTLKDFVLLPFDKREQPLVEQAIVWVVSEILTAIEAKHVVSRTLTKGA